MDSINDTSVVSGLQGAGLTPGGVHIDFRWKDFYPDFPDKNAS